MQLTVTCTICDQQLLTVTGEQLGDADITYYEKAVSCQTDGNNGTNIVATIVDDQ